MKIASYQPEGHEDEMSLKVKVTGVSFTAGEKTDKRDLKRGNEILDQLIKKKKLSTLFTIGTVGVALLAGLLILMAVKFKNRELQLRIGRFLFFFFLCLFVGMFFAADFGKEVLESNLDDVYGIDNAFGISYGAGLFMPAAAAAFVFLANLGIKRDEKLVKSLDRLR